MGEPGDDDPESATTALFDREREAQEFSREAERGSPGRSGTEEWHAIEGELAATRRQLEEAHERAAAAERRATEIEIEARREIERERETRVREIEGTARSRKPAAPSLSSASFDELRELGMSVAQAKRVIRHREENDGFDTVDELDRIAGFPKAFLTEIKNRVSA